jgi:hypothetical protein
VSYPLSGVTPKTVVAADLNHDGRPDLVVWTTQVFPGDTTTPVKRRIAVLMNRGDGTFAPPVYYSFWEGPWEPLGSAIVADLDHDGAMDIACTAAGRDGPGAIVTLHGRGDGTFEPWQLIPVADLPVSVVAADLRGHGSLDLAVMHNSGPGSAPPGYLTVLYNDGNGGFPTRTEYADAQLVTGSDVGGQLAVADFDGDGRLDVALHDNATSTTLVMLNQGDGTFARPVSYGVCGSAYGLFPRAVFAADLNHDGRPDLLTLNASQFHSFLPNLSCPSCYANCDNSTTPPVLNVNDFTCFLNKFAAGDPSANCDSSTTPPTLNVNDFVCFVNRFSQGCP